VAIAIDRLISFARNLLSEPEPAYWSDGDMLQYLNSALDFVIYEVYDATEFTFLQKGTVSIVSADVTSKNQFLDLPARTVYVSDYAKYDQLRGRLDLRPELAAGSANSRRLVLEQDYEITGSQMFLFEAPTAIGTITVHYKAKHPEILNPTGDLEKWLPDVAMNALVVYMVEYAKLRDEANEPEISRVIRPLLQAHIDRLRGFLIGMHGKPRMWRSNFDFPR
jgi:hypothetical protein